MLSKKGRKSSFAVALSTLVFALFSVTTASAQEQQPTEEPTPAAEQQESPVTFDLLLLALGDAEAQTAALEALTDLEAADVQVISAQDLVGESEEQAAALAEVVTASEAEILALQGALGEHEAFTEALLSSQVPAEEVIALLVLDDEVIVFHE